MLKEVAFEDVLPIWRNKLWPGRESPIKAASSIVYLGGYDMSIYRFQPTFWGWERDGALIGCVSAFQTDDTSYRLRGLYVDEIARGLGIGVKLAQAVEERARALGLTNLWIMPRMASWPFYEKLGYVRTSEPFTEGTEFGPNCYGLKLLD